MARLNEPPLPAAESIDTLKRRFIRQNREIARVNSSQSQRIRNLETEISRLLSENIALREQAIRANEKAEKLRTSSRLSRDVLVLKEKLAVRLGEVNLLVEELGGLPERASRRSSIGQRRRSIVQNLARSPEARESRNRQTLSLTANPEQEGRLPAIMEDKYYPRRTLEVAEIQAFIGGDNNEDVESPELGPPPIVHFDVNDPIVFDSNKSPKRISGGILSDDQEIIALPNTLETRRKRRHSSLTHDLTSVDDNRTGATESASTQDKPSTVVSTRKVDIQELDENRPPALQDDFVFQRKSASTTDRPRPSRFTSRSSRQVENEPNQTALPMQKTIQSSRPVLAVKSTNSPTKNRTTSTLLKKDLIKADSGDEKKQKPARAITVTKVGKPTQINLSPSKQVETITDDTQPKTPGIGLLQLMSPESASTEPSTESRVTTKAEIAFTNSVEDVLNGSIGRGSRRARAAVSYAEPNLRDKMRRPDKKLVGAVEGLNKTTGSENPLSRSLNSEPTEPAKARQSLSDIGVNNLEEVKVKSESDHAYWTALPTAASTTRQKEKEEATSPLRDKQRAPLLERRHKRTFSEVDNTSLKSLPRKPVTDEITSSIEQLSIFDPPSSSPIAPRDELPERPSSRSSKDATAGSRRISSTSASTTSNTSTSTALKSRRHSIQVQQGSTTLPSSRPSSAASMRDTSVKESVSSTRLKRASSVQALSRLQDAAKAHDEMGDDQAAGRTIGTRRRSMMV